MAKEDGAYPLIPSVEGLTSQVLGALKSKYDAQITALLDELKPKKDIETLLSRIRALSKVIGRTKVHDLDAVGYEAFGEAICGEIGKVVEALKGVARTFRVNPTDGSEQLVVPYWAMDINDVVQFVMGKVEEKSLTAVLDRILEEKQASLAKSKFAGVSENSLTITSPIPFSLKKLWHDLIDPELKTTKDNQGLITAQTSPGDAETLTPPKYPPAGPGNTTPFLNKVGVLSIRRQLAQLRSRLLDRQYDFMLHPGKWEPKLDGTVECDLAELLESWIGHDKPITILDLSGIPSVVMTRLIGGILNIIYEGLFWGRELPEGGRQRPELIVMEEAHRYLGGKDDSQARDMVQRIVKEGRKFGVGAMIVSQRPSEIDDTILSQCGTFFALRLTNANDRSTVRAALPDNLSGVVDSLPVLRTAELFLARVVTRFANAQRKCRAGKWLPRDRKDWYD